MMAAFFLPLTSSLLIAMLTISTLTLQTMKMQYRCRQHAGHLYQKLLNGSPETKHLQEWTLLTAPDQARSQGFLEVAWNKKSLGLHLSHRCRSWI